MFRIVKHFFIVVLVGVISWGCSSEPELKKAHISGNFTVSDSIDDSGDYSGIGVTITKKDSANADADTLFYAVSDSNGSFSGMATFEEKGQYPMWISRNNRNLARVGVILANKDSMFVTGQLPNVDETLTVDSREHNAMKKFQRVGSNFQRITEFARAGRLTGDTLRQELLKWSDIYWDVHTEEEGTIASEMSARESIRILESVDKQKMMNRIRSVQDDEALSDLGATYGKNYIAQNMGLEPAVAYLDSLAGITESREKRMRLNMEQIKLLYDSAKISSAKDKLAAFKETYPDDERPKEWIESITYDLNYLSPGDAIPEFEFAENGKMIGRDSLLGTPYILEITRLGNRLYQDQFDRAVVIHSIYKNFGLQVVTIPLDESQITVDAFFEARVKPWPVAGAQAFDRQQLLEKFNVQRIPTRFLVDQEGKIVRKYVGNEFDDVIQGIQSIIKKNKEDEEPAS